MMDASPFALRITNTLESALMALSKSHVYK